MHFFIKLEQSVSYYVSFYKGGFHMCKVVKWLVICIALCFIYFITNYFTYDFTQFDGEKDGKAITSPDGSYSAQVYYQNYGGAAGGVNMFVNVIFHLEDNIERTVYFSDAKGNVRLTWLDGNILSITNYNEFENRNINLIVGKEIYDELGSACSHYKMKKKYICYSSEQSKNGS